MNKFESDCDDIEICSVGTTIPYYLNRFVILLLGMHGVDRQIFIDMQKDMLDDLDEMLLDSDKAMYLVPRLAGPDSSVRGTILKMLHCGLNPSAEPFLGACLHAIRSHHLQSLRKKSRILVEDGCVLMGGIDETGLLPGKLTLPLGR